MPNIINQTEKNAYLEDGTIIQLFDIKGSSTERQEHDNPYILKNFPETKDSELKAYKDIDFIESHKNVKLRTLDYN